MLIIERTIVKYPYEGTDFSTISNFYSEEKNKNKICLFYNGDELKTLISYDDFSNWKSETEYNFYLKTSNNNKTGYKFEHAESVFRRFPFWHCITIKLEEYKGEFIQNYKSHVDEIANNEMYAELKKHGVNVFRVKIPSKADLNERIRADRICSIYLSHYTRLIMGGDINPPHYFDKITDISADKIGMCDSVHGKSFGEGNRTIFMVGPCIVAGWDNQDGEKLVQIVAQKLHNREYRYKVESVRYFNGDSSDKYNLLTHKIKQNDIVFLINNHLRDCEIDMTAVYNSYSGDKFLYTDDPIHTTVTGNRLIADKLIKDAIIPLNLSCDIIDDQNVIYEGINEFGIDVKNEVRDFTDKIKAIRYLPDNISIGAIVMNCNPFTYGHRHLVEYAAAKVDYLYLFVVEEDLSAVPFVDRLFLVQEGTKDIPNVIVIPSGKFIISKDTFFNYFDKENDTHEANAEEDVEIFGRFIAKELHITKRFVGEEPFDDVTNSYNSMMKDILPGYGVELVEIPRKNYDGEDKAINATAVRNALEKDDFETVNKSVPIFVSDYLRRNKDTVIHRIHRLKEKEGNRVNRYIQEAISDLIEQISSFDKIVLYSTGIDTRGIVKCLPDTVLERIEYCDKSADKEDVYFNGKKVHSTKELVTSLKDYHIVVGTTGFGEQVYEEFLNNGIDMSRCTFNTISFYSEA